MTALNIAFVSSSDTAGGAEAHTVALGDGLHRRGHDVVLYGDCPGWTDHGLPRGELHLGPKWSRKTLPMGILRVPAEQRRVRSLPPASLYYLQFKREQVSLTRSLSRKAPVIWTEHGRWMGGRAGRMLMSAYARAAEHVSAIVCVSADVATDLSQSVDPAKLLVVSNSVDTQRFQPVSAQRQAVLREQLLPAGLPQRPVAVLASRLHAAKHHDRAIAAAKASGSTLVVVGDGPDRPRLQALADGQQVFFAGHQQDVTAFLALADYYIYCGAETDGTPTSVLEAASAGLPVVAFAGDPGVELVPAVGGVVLGDPCELTPDITGRLTGMRGAGVSYVEEHHSRERWLDSYERVLRKYSA